MHGQTQPSFLAHELSLLSFKSQLIFKDFLKGGPPFPAPGPLALATPRNLASKRKYITWLWMASPFLPLLGGSSGLGTGKILMSGFIQILSTGF